MVDEGGRPTKYKSTYNKQAYKLCLLGATDAELADFFEVCEATINNWKVEYPRFLESIRNGKKKADMEVVNALYGGTQDRIVVEQQAFKVKKVFYENGKRCETEEIAVADVERVIAADFRNQQFWLKNRAPQTWRDKVDVTNTNFNVNVEVTEEEARKIKSAIDKDI